MDDRWNVAPDPLQYLREASEKYSANLICPYDETLKRHVRFVERMSQQQRNVFEQTCRKIVSPGEMSVIGDWCESVSHGTETERHVADSIRQLLWFLMELAEDGMPPFDEILRGVEIPFLYQKDAWNWDLPKDLRYIIGPALYFGERFPNESKMLHFFERSSRSEQEWLTSIATRIGENHDWPRISQWLSDSKSLHTLDVWRLGNLMDLCDMDCFD
ncbi:hypothetical protein C5Y96_21705 [Blastopirellula marina]|uniref:Uncharacterized protein n=1 Tax=Blastopirellula marina TaxID=124 RepID=A0A2S8F1L6_9BACT|nr:MULTISPECIES: hypothetical protein [Pirellulaceae]PQO26068.1 hypothetical protein C5Y96_21705 [Blastopirellula marina]RCS44426.1 hypothetical protein DTL36_21750 [Bremerella cremea]